MVSEHLLVAESNLHLAKLIELSAVALGYRVSIVTSFDQIKSLLGQQHDFFLATIAYRLPDAPDGEAVAYVLDQDIQAVVITDEVDDQICNKILDLPVVDYVTKENDQIDHYLSQILRYQRCNRQIGVLVVDDSLTARKHVAELLERRNYTVYDVADGLAALHTLAEHDDIKMVITDNIMPGMTGIELVKKLRKQYSKNTLAIIGLSSSSRDFQSARFIKSGADDFLRKPFCPEEFYCRILQNFERLQQLEDIQRAADTDYLTGLYNRRYFFEKAGQICNNVPGQASLLVMADLDHFKNINDSYGHDTGDQVLIELANLLGQHFADDLVARLGGEEFAIIIAGKTIADLERRLNAFRRAVANNDIHFKGNHFNFTLSMGATEVNGEDSLEQLISQADLVLYQAKDSGRDRLVLYRALTG